MTQNVTQEELRALAATTKGAKYGNTRGVLVPELNRRFDSQHEADAAVTLHRRQQAGEIRDLQFQVKFPLEVNGVKVCTYVSDFVFLERHEAPTLAAQKRLPGPVVESAFGSPVVWCRVIADAKSPPTRTPVYRLKKKLMAACLGIGIVEL